MKTITITQEEPSTSICSTPVNSKDNILVFRIFNLMYKVMPISNNFYS